jgi:peptide/nickel transport system substrate-binding protein
MEFQHSADDLRSRFLQRPLFIACIVAVFASGVVFAQDKDALAAAGGLDLVPGAPGGTLTMALPDAPASFMYYGVIDSNLHHIAQQLFDGLVEYNLEDYSIEPGLARSWTISEDGTVWTFHLREGVLWHDGTELTADDVVFTYEQIVKNPEARAGDPSHFYFGGGEVTFERVDDYTVQVNLPEPSAPFMDRLRYFIMPKHVLLPYSAEGGADLEAINNAWPTDGDLRDVIGTGPFRLASYVPGQLVRLERNPNYWKVDGEGTRLPYVDALDFLIVRGSAQQTAQFLAGNLDILNITGAQFPDLKSRELAGADFRVVQSDALFGSPPHLAFNFDAADPMLAELFSNLDFRRAMQAAVDRDRFIDIVYNGLATLPGHGVAPISSFYVDTREYFGTFDLEEAAAMLDALGLVDTDGNGLRNLEPGRDLELTLTYNVDSSEYTAMATILQNDLAEIGIRVNLQGIQGSALLGTGRSGDFEAILLGFGDLVEFRKGIWQPGAGLYYWHRSTHPADTGEPPNFDAMTDWELRIWEIFEEGVTILDFEERRDLYAEWQVLFAENLPVIMILKPVNVAAVHNRIGNFVYSLGVIPGYNPVPVYYVH